MLNQHCFALVFIKFYSAYTLRVLLRIFIIIFILPERLCNASIEALNADHAISQKYNKIKGDFFTLFLRLKI